MTKRLFDFNMNDGSRNFMNLPTNIIGWSDLYKYLGKLDGVKKTGFLTDNVTEVWMDFSFRGYNFSVNNQMGEYWFFSENAECPEAVLDEIVEYCEKLLKK